MTDHIKRIFDGMYTTFKIVIALAIITLIVAILAIVGKIMLAFSTLLTKLTIVLVGLVVLFYIVGYLQHNLRDHIDNLRGET